jgi:hypothetical protein
MSADKKSPGTNWLIWLLNALVGAACGLLGGVFIAYGRRRGTQAPPLFSSPEAGTFVIGAILLGAAFGSYFGEGCSLGPSICLISPEGYSHSLARRVASILLGLIGVALMVVSVCHEKKVF